MKSPARQRVKKFGKGGLGTVLGYGRKMEDRLRTPGLRPEEQERIKRAIEQGYTDLIYHSTDKPWDEIDLNYTDVGFHAGTPIQATNRALDKAIQAGLQKSRSEGQYIDTTNILPLAYRPSQTLVMPDVGEWKNSFDTLLSMRNTPTLRGQDWVDELLDLVDFQRNAFTSKSSEPWLESPENRLALEDIRKNLLDRGIRQVRYENQVENRYGGVPGLLPEYYARAGQLSREADALYKKAMGLRPMHPPPELGATEEAVQAWLNQGSPDPLAYLHPEEAALYRKYQNEIDRIKLEPKYQESPNSLIFLDPADLRSAYAPFDPSKAGEVGLWKAEGGPVKMADGGPVFDPGKIDAMADELMNPYYKFEPYDDEAYEVQKFGKGGLAGSGQKARQWLKDVVENAIANYRVKTPAGTDPEQALQELQQAMAQQDVQALPEGTRAAFQRSLEDLQRKTALNSWLGRTATKYIKRDYGAEWDPLRAQEFRHMEGDWPPVYDQMFADTPPVVLGLQTYPASAYTAPSNGKYYDERRRLELLEQNPWISSLAPDEPIYQNSDIGGGLGISHLRDELGNAMNPASGLPRDLQIRPESLQRMSFPQASELVGRINQWRSAQEAVANQAIANNPATTVLKEYPEGYRWVQLGMPKVGDDADLGAITDALNNALEYEGNQMGHSVAGYRQPRRGGSSDYGLGGWDALTSGQAQVYSLRDAQGMPHVTIEAGRDLPDFEDFTSRDILQWAQRNKNYTGPSYTVEELHNIRRESPEVFERIVAEMLPPTTRITQIKGKGNKAPADKYKPFVQDFIRGREWSAVGELNNAGLLDAAQVLRGKPQPQQRFMTQGEYDDYLLQLLREQQSPGMKEGGDVKGKKDLYSTPPEPGLLEELLQKYAPEVVLDAIREAGELKDSYSSGFDAQYLPDRPILEGGMPGLALATASIPGLVQMVTGPLDETGMYPVDKFFGATNAASSRYDEHLNRLLEKYGLPSTSGLDPMDRYAVAAGEMLGQLPVPGAWLKRFGTLSNKVPRPVRWLTEYFGPIVDPKLSNYAIGTGIGGTLRQFEEPSTEELPETAPEPPVSIEEGYAPPSFPAGYGYAKGGLVYDPDRIEALAGQLMEPEKFGRGGLADATGKTKKAAENAAEAAARSSALNEAEAGRIAEAVKGEMVEPAPRRGKAVRRQGPGYDVEAVASAYPTTGPGQLNFKNPSKPEGFMEKVLTPEERMLQLARKSAQSDIALGNYDPMFALEDRYYATPSLYDIQGNTLIDAMPKKQATIDRFLQRFDTPEVRSNLLSAYYRGLSPMSEDWYALGQLQDAFIRELGPEEGARQFSERFADAMAATTGGADPTANLLMAAYVNNMKLQGLSLPEGSFNYPHPIGGRYLSGNMSMADKILMQNNPLTTAEHPKRFNFRANFLGDRGRATIDEQMSSLYEPKLASPPGASYGIMEGILHDVANSIGVLPANFQDVGWAGAKGVEGKPMIQHLNEAIERTSRVTGRTPEQVLRDSVIRATRPLYAKGGLAAYKDAIGT